MTDYTWSTGSSATMMIRDTGSNIEFWLNAGNSTTWTDHLPWSGTVNGSGVGGSYYYHPNSGWNRLGVWGVGSSQNVTFAIGNTGTSGFGGPSSHTVFINRASIPSAPSAPTFSSLTSTSVTVTFVDGANNGASIDNRLVGYGTVDNTSSVSYSGPTNITGLTPGQKYYFWAATHNSQGWSPWSVRSEITMLRVPDAPSMPIMSDITQISALASFTPNADGGAAIDQYQTSYSTLTSPGSHVVTATSPQIIPGLTPATTYYVWARAHNSIGWSPWSAMATMKTIAGASIRVGAVMKDAIPYVRVGGVWKVARPWVKMAGVWKETI